MSKKYSIIYADPPWRYKNYNNPLSKRGAAKEYPTMRTEEIAALPVSGIAHDNAILFLWTCFPVLQDSFEVMKSWGFDYKTVGFVWIKRNRHKDSFFWGMGSWTRSNSEICLIGTRGVFKRQSAAVHQVVYEPVRAHSQKPDIVRDKIIQLCGDVPKIELFARAKTDGWDVWGNEVESSISF